MSGDNPVVDVVVVGGGLIGMLTARELALAGRRVRLLERKQVGRESSWAGGGILSPLYPWRYPDAVSRLARWSQQHYPDLTAELAARTGVDPEYTPSGLLVLEEADPAGAEQWAARFGASLRRVAAAEIAGLEPELAPAQGDGLWMPEVAQVRNPRLMQALRAAAVEAGVVLEEDCAVTAVDVDGQGVTGVRTALGPRPARQVVIAGGAWTAGLLEPTGLRLPVEPVRGQMLLYRASPGLVRHITLSGERYVIPRRDGRVLVGSTQERVGFVKETTDIARRDLQAAAEALVPALARVPIEHHWAGLRPGSPDGVPFIGPHPGVAGLYVNAGHFRNGVVLGLASARLLADQLLEREPILDPAPYLPEIV